jgi:hypothetical protein
MALKLGAYGAGLYGFGLYGAGQEPIRWYPSFFRDEGCAYGNNMVLWSSDRKRG